MSSISKIAVPLIGFGGVIAAASMLLIAPARADTTEQQFLNALQAGQITFQSGDEMLADAGTVRGFQAALVSEAELSQKLHSKAGLPQKQADVFVQAATSAFCPSKANGWLS